MIIKSKKGVTLIELLLVIFLSSIIMTVITSLIIYSTNLYFKSEISYKTSDESNYITSQIFNELTDNGQLDGTVYSIEDLGDNTLEIVLSKKSILDTGVVVNTITDSFLLTVENEKIIIKQGVNSQILNTNNYYTPNATIVCLNENDEKCLGTPNEIRILFFSFSIQYKDSNGVKSKIHTYQTTFVI